MQILELAAKLQSTGLPNKQAKVYVASLFLGPSAVQKIATQANVNRATAYVILDELITMGLISQSSEGKKTVFVAEAPTALARHLDSVKEDIQHKQGELQSLLPELEQIERTHGAQSPQVYFFKGKEGHEQVNKYYRKHAKAGSTVYVFTDNDEVDRIVPRQLVESPNFRLKKKISSRVFDSGVKHGIATDPKMLRQAKKLPFKAAADIELQEEFALLSSYKGDKPVSMVIESRDVVAALRQLFELAWNNTKDK